MDLSLIFIYFIFMLWLAFIIIYLLAIISLWCLCCFLLVHKALVRRVYSILFVVLHGFLQSVYAVDQERGWVQGPLCGGLGGLMIFETINDERSN